MIPGCMRAAGAASLDVAFGGRGGVGKGEPGRGQPIRRACRPSACSSLGRIGADTPLRLLFQLLIASPIAASTTATSATATPAAESPAAPAGTCRLRTRLVHGQPSSAEFRFMQLRNGALRLLVGPHFNEREPARPPRHLIAD